MVPYFPENSDRNQTHNFSTLIIFHMRPVTRRWARLGTHDPKMLRHPSDAGVCLSTFVVVRRGRSILLGRPRGGDAWPKKGGYPKHLAAQLEEDGAWLLPAATHLLMEESPDHAANRIVHQWAGLKGRPRFVMVQSHIRRRAEGNHWDLCFVYDLPVPGRPRRRPWWSELRFTSIPEVRKMNIGRGHRDVLEEAGYL